MSSLDNGVSTSVSVSRGVARRRRMDLRYLIFELLLSRALPGALFLLFLIWSLAALGRCFGIFPEARGLVTRGPYRLARHPVYLGELVAVFGMVVATLSPALFGLFLATIALQYWRTINEERALGEAFPEYAKYQSRTWRLVPFVH